MIKVSVREVCGCCNTDMFFESVESAERAFDAAGLTSSATIVDDAGDTHTKVDTFYGFTVEEANERDLLYLVSLLGR